MQLRLERTNVQVNSTMCWVGGTRKALDVKGLPALKIGLGTQQESEIKDNTQADHD